MPTTTVVFFKRADGSVPILDWLDGLVPKAQVKCLAKLRRLEDLGYDRRRPEADLLRNGVYELRIGLQGVNYRILYFFHGNKVAMVTHGLTKERQVPEKEIDQAVACKQEFEKNPKRHTFEPGA